MVVRWARVEDNKTDEVKLLVQDSVNEFNSASNQHVGNGRDFLSVWYWIYLISSMHTADIFAMSALAE